MDIEGVGESYFIMNYHHLQALEIKVTTIPKIFRKFPKIFFIYKLIDGVNTYIPSI